MRDDIKIVTYADGAPPETDGNSTISNHEFSADTLKYSYTLGKEYLYRYAGLSIGMAKDSTFLNLSDYDFIKIKMHQSKESSIGIFFKIYNPNFTKLNESATHETLIRYVSADTAAISEMIVNFDDFSHPNWWLEDRKLEKSEMSSPDFSKVLSLQIQNGTRYTLDSLIEVSILDISVGKDFTSQYIGLLIILAAYYLIVLILILLNKKGETKGEKKVVISYEKLDVESNLDQDTKRITDTIAKNYSDPTFSVDKLSKEAGISAAKIPGVLKNQYSMNFKQYLNNIRINEAKRLLKETDNQIVNIAYAVGYNNIPHFNRTFKQLEGVSPKEYRKSGPEQIA